MTIRVPDETKDRNRSIYFRWNLGPSAETSYGENNEDWAELTIAHNNGRKSYNATFAVRKEGTKGGMRFTEFLVGSGLLLWFPEQPATRYNTKSQWVYAHDALENVEALLRAAAVQLNKTEQVEALLVKLQQPTEA